jgi:hypothetical protein
MNIILTMCAVIAVCALAVIAQELSKAREALEDIAQELDYMETNRNELKAE